MTRYLFTTKEAGRKLNLPYETVLCIARDVLKKNRQGSYYFLTQNDIDAIESLKRTRTLSEL